MTEAAVTEAMAEQNCLLDDGCGCGENGSCDDECAELSAKVLALITRSQTDPQCGAKLRLLGRILKEGLS